ncbi:hypothetical protein ACWDSD_38420, partial [Streptomyces spiralis]
GSLPMREFERVVLRLRGAPGPGEPPPLSGIRPARSHALPPQSRRSEAGTRLRNRAHPGSIGPATDLVSTAHPL